MCGRLALAVCLLPAVAAADPVLDRNLADYFVFAERSAQMANTVIEPPGCNVGINCAQPGDSNRCGVLRSSGMTIAAPGQVAADYLCGPGSFYDVFHNRPSACAPTCAMTADPGPAADCSTPFATPILG